MSQNRRNKPSSGLASCAGCEGCDDDVGDGDTLRPAARGVALTETDSDLGPLGGPPAVTLTYPQGKGADSWLASEAARMVGEYHSLERLKSNAPDVATSPARRPSSPSKTELAQVGATRRRAPPRAPPHVLLPPPRAQQAARRPPAGS